MPAMGRSPSFSKAPCDSTDRRSARACASCRPSRSAFFRAASSSRLALGRDGLCEACGRGRFEWLSPCHHEALCAACAQTREVCLTCGVRHGAFGRVRGATGADSKLGEIVALLRRLHPEPVLLFVQWKTMLRKVQHFLHEAAVPAHALEGSASQRARTLAAFEHGGVLVLCLEDSFAGLHLTHVGHVLFAHAIVGAHDEVARLERQAIARCVRPGQTRHVQVYSFVVSESEEETLWHITH